MSKPPFQPVFWGALPGWPRMNPGQEVASYVANTWVPLSGLWCSRETKTSLLLACVLVF